MPKLKQSLAWFGDRTEIEHVIDVLRDLGEALRTQELSARQRAQLSREGIPYLKRVLDNALRPWATARPARQPNGFEAPILRALDVLGDKHAGELESADLDDLGRHLIEAHLARLDANATVVAMRRQLGASSSAAVRGARASTKHGKVRAAANRLLAAGRPERDIPGILAQRHGLSARQIRNIIRAKKRK